MIAINIVCKALMYVTKIICPNADKGADKKLNPRYNMVFLKFIFKKIGGNTTFISIKMESQRLMVIYFMVGEHDIFVGVRSFSTYHLWK